MERRTALKVLAAAIAWLLARAESGADLPPDYLEHTVIFRQSPDGPAMFDDGTDTSIGTVWWSFYEVWEIRDGRQVRRLSQCVDREHRIVSRDERHRFSFDDPNATHLQDVTDEHAA
jgi:hypothetical protein